MKGGVIFFALAASLLFLAYTFSTKDPDTLLQEEPEHLEIPQGLPPMPWPADNPYTKKKAELGRLLYFDKRLSADGTIACASCHSIPKAFTDNLPVSEGIYRNKGTRNAPTVINSGYSSLLFWDGRAKSLEEQCMGPISNPKEMSGTPNVHAAHMECLDRVKKINGYKPLFKEVFGTEDFTLDQISKAIATFERTVLSGNSRFDKRTLTAEELNGLKLFKAKGCANCHYGPNFSDDQFHNIGVGMNEPNPDPGRYDVTKNPEDFGAFKTPILREVSKTYPYMHDGSLQTLEEVVEFYNQGGVKNKNLHPAIRKLNLTDQEKKDLVSFMKALDGDGWQHFTEPAAYPQ